MSEMPENTEKSQPEFLRKQFELLVGLYKFYFESLIKLSIFSLGIVGIILAYLLKDLIPNYRHFSFALAAPFLISLSALAAACFFGWKSVELNKKLNYLQDKLGIEQKIRTDILTFVSVIFAFVFFILLICLIVLFNNP